MPEVDQNICTGCQICAQTAPETFEMGDDGLAHAIGDEVTPEAEQAAQQCPVDCISL